MKTVLIAAFLTVLLLLPELDQGVSGLRVLPDVVLILAMQWLLRRRFPDYRRVRVGVVAIGWTTLFVFQIARWVGRKTMDAELVLYDSLQLVRNLGDLAVDVYGPMVIGAGVIGAVLATIGIGAITASVARWVDEDLEPTRLGAAGMLFLLTATVLPSGWLGARLAQNLSDSFSLYHRVHQAFQSDAYASHYALSLEQRPDVRIYIIESLGMVVYRDEGMKEQWAKKLLPRASQLKSAGWRLAAGRSDAPVRGGRSWIADASVLLGREVQYQAEFTALTAQSDQLPSLPKFFNEHGYQSILARPTDRPRPGLPVANYFGFHHTVFFNDLKYVGEPMGWGIVPDQYTVAWLDQRRFQVLEKPQFSFVHLASSHWPWRYDFQLVRDWESLQQTTTGVGNTTRKPANKIKTPLRQLRRSARFYARPENIKVGAQRKIKQSDRSRYASTALYSLDSILATMEERPNRPTLLLIFGDHQPPFLAERGVSDVPVLVASTHRRLLREFLDHGFVRGWTPKDEGPPGMRHGGFFSIIARALARFDKKPLPPAYPNGADDL